MHQQWVDSSCDQLRHGYSCLLSSATIPRLLSMSQAGRITEQDFDPIFVACEAAQSRATAAALLWTWICLGFQRLPCYSFRSGMAAQWAHVGTEASAVGGDSAWDQLRHGYTCPLSSATIPRLLSLSWVGRVTAQDYYSVVAACETARPWATAAVQQRKRGARVN